MGVKFAREYNDIVDEFVIAIEKIEQFYDFFEMSPQDWEQLDIEMQRECLKTMADDLFYALGEDRLISVGKGTISYEPKRHIIVVTHSNNVVNVVNLI